jgi:DNA polymerase I-like protein with 3'-5' exonuclease and polymerase domains
LHQAAASPSRHGPLEYGISIALITEAVLLIFWTAAKADAITRTIGVSLKAMRPDVPEHEFRPVKGEELVVPGPGQIVICCGSKPLDILKANKLVPKGRTLSALREKPYKTMAAGGSYMMTYDPTIVANEPDKKALIDWDIRLALRLLKTGSLDPVLGNYIWVGSLKPLIASIKTKFKVTGETVDLSTDTETMGLYPWYPDKDILMIGFSMYPGTAEMLVVSDKYPTPPGVVYDSDDDLWEQLHWLLTTPLVKLRGANLKFDLIWIAEKWGIECTNFVFDTALAGSLLDENRSNGLTTHTKTLTDLGGYDTPLNTKYDKGQMHLVPVSEMTTYFGGDLDGAFQVADVLRDQLMEDGDLARFYVKVVHPAVRAFEKIERRGLVIDKPAFVQLGDDLAKEIKECEKLAMALIPRRLRIKHMDKIESQLEAGKSPFNTSLTSEFFFGPLGLNLKPKMLTEKTGQPSTARAHLSMFADHPDAKEMVKLLETIGSASKTKSTYVDGFMKHLRPDGKLHPTYMLFHGGFNDDENDESGTVSGRLSCKDPAFQTVPKKTKWTKRIRACFPAPPGKTCVVLDFSQGELRVVACLAPEHTMIAAYEQGQDLHALTGAKLSGHSWEQFQQLKIDDPAKHALIRDKAKPANFGLLYGMGAEGFKAYCWAQYGLLLTLEDAEAMRHAFFELYPGLLTYHENMRRFVRGYQHVRSPLGRIRHLGTIKSWDRKVQSYAERQAINSPVQAALTDMMIWAIAEIEAQIPADKFAVVGMVHDSLVAYADEKEFAYWAKQAGQIMQTLPLHELDWVPPLMFPADAEAGPNLAALSKIKLTG